MRLIYAALLFPYHFILVVSLSFGRWRGIFTFPGCLKLYTRLKRDNTQIQAEILVIEAEGYRGFQQNDNVWCKDLPVSFYTFNAGSGSSNLSWSLKDVNHAPLSRGDSYSLSETKSHPITDLAAEWPALGFIFKLRDDSTGSQVDWLRLKFDSDFCASESVISQFTILS